MSSHRTARIAEAIREVVSTAILFEMADPRIKGITVLRAEVSGDLRNASVFVSIMGTETEQTLTLRALQHAAGFLQSRVAARLQLRFTPALSFKLDESVKKSIAVTRLIEEARAQAPAADPGDLAALDDEGLSEAEHLGEPQEWGEPKPISPLPKPDPPNNPPIREFT